ncbi:hypothetical protein FKP32DRAFT_1250287 [Trametes sanguinea]|nr:hypothetical protein FKP32DRAFT_1250287 [Trametes sanguinea]
MSSPAAMPSPVVAMRPRSDSSTGCATSHCQWTSAASPNDHETADNVTPLDRWRLRVTRCCRTSVSSAGTALRTPTVESDDLGYLSEGTMSTLPPSYRTRRPTVANWRGQRPPRPLPSPPSPPPLAGSGSVPTEPPAPTGEPRRNIGRPSRRSRDGGVRLDGGPLDMLPEESTNGEGRPPPSYAYDRGGVPSRRAARPRRQSMRGQKPKGGRKLAAVS